LLTHLDLPCEDGLPVDNLYQPTQWVLLSDSIRPHLKILHPDGNYLAAMDMGIYFRITESPLKGCRCPDFFYVPGVPGILPDSLYRRSYVLWQERVPPTLVVELVPESSNGAEHDRTPHEGKFWIYENAIQALYYAIYDPQTVKIELYHLVEGRYQLVEADDDGLYPILPMKVRLGTQYGLHDLMTGNWLRFFDENGEMLENSLEKLTEERTRRRREVIRANREQQRADQESKRADNEQLRAEQQQQRAEQLAAKLRELGIDPENV